MSAFKKKYILVSLILIFASCKVAKKNFDNNLATTKTIYIVYTQKNCFECFNKLNNYLYNKYSDKKNEFKINYIFYKSSFVNTYVVISKLKKIPNLTIVDFKINSVLLKINSFLDEKKISPYLIVDSSNSYRLIDYKELFDKKGNVKNQTL